MSDTSVTVQCVFGNVYVDVCVDLPCILTCDICVQTPKTISVADLIKAKGKPPVVETITDSNFELKSQVEIIENVVSVTPRLGRMFAKLNDALDALAAWLRENKCL